MATENLYPAIRPSLDLNFAGSKTLDPRITFSRASAATYYDGKTVAKAEENLLLQSQEIGSVPWTRAGTSGSLNAATAPDGSVTADLVYPLTVATNQGVYQGGLISQLNTAVPKVFSIYAKAAGIPYLLLMDANTGGQKTYFNLSNGTVGTVAANHTASIESVGNGWYRCIVFTSIAWSATAVLGWYLSDADNSALCTANGTSGAYLWGAQLEQRSQVTAYTPTTTQPITNYIPVLQTAPANAPRFDHNPVTGESLGLLVEEQRTNLITRSQDLTASVWSKGGSSISVSGVSPDGTVSASRLTEDTALGVHTTSQPYASAVGATTYTFSVYVKPAGRSSVQLWSSGGSPRFSAKFDLANKSSTPIANVGSAVLLAHSIESVGNGWYRISITGAQNIDNVFSAYILLDNGVTNLYQGDGYSGIYIWGAQLEAGAFPTSYIKTEASQVTRAADSASMTGANFSSWYRQDEGTIAVESILRSVIGTDAYVAAISGGNIDNTIRLGHLTNGNARRLNVRANAVNTVALDIFPASVSDVVYKQSASYKVNDFATSSNGSNVAKTAAGAIPYNLDKLVIGASALYVRRIAYYPKRLTDAQLQALTA